MCCLFQMTTRMQTVTTGGKPGGPGTAPKPGQRGYGAPGDDLPPPPPDMMDQSYQQRAGAPGTLTAVVPEYQCFLTMLN